MKVVVETETGEILDEIKEGDRIRRKSQDDYCKGKGELIDMTENGNFIKIFNKTMAMLGGEGLTANEYQICLQLLNYIEYESGILKYANTGKQLNSQDISDITGICYKGVVRAMQTLVSKKIYGVHKTGKENCYTVNPFIFMKGKYINKTLYNFYKKSKWAKL